MNRRNVINVPVLKLKRNMKVFVLSLKETLAKQ